MSASRNRPPPSAMKSLPALLKKIAGLRILVVGDVMLDHYIWGDATRISPEAPVPVVDIARDSWTAGGAANVALNIASLGARCSVAGYFGKDEAGTKLTEILSERKIATLPTPGTAATILKTRVLVQHQQLCRLDREHSPDAYEIDVATVAPLLRKAIAACDAVILSDYAKGILSDAVVSRITTLARAGGKFIALDPKPKRKLAFHGLDLITPNKRESLQLAGVEQPPHAKFPAVEVCARLHELYATKHVVITLGEDLTQALLRMELVEHYAKILHTACLIGPMIWAMDAKSFYKRTSPYEGKLGRLIMDRRLTLSNQPRHPDLLGNGFNSEGFPAEE